MRATLSLIAAITVPWSMPSATAQNWADAGPDQWVCGDSTDLQAGALTPLDTGYWFLSQGTATIINSTDPSTAVTDLGLGENVLIWVLINSFGATSDFVSIRAYDPAAPVADAGPDQLALPLYYITNLNANPFQAPCVCSWTVISGPTQVQDPGSPTSLVLANAPGTSVLQWTCDNGPCGITSDQVVLDDVLGTGLASTMLSQVASIRHDPGQDVLVISAPHAQARLDVLGGNGQYIRSLGTLSTADLPAGLYIARMIHGDHVQSLRFVVSR
jgi:hypothetical protein